MNIVAAASDTSCNASLATPKFVVPVGSVHKVVGTHLDAGAVAAPPPAAELRSFAVERGADGTLSGRVTFAGPFVAVDRLAGITAAQSVFLNLYPPSGDTLQVTRTTAGTGVVRDLHPGAASTDIGSARVAVDGGDVVIAIPAVLNVTPDWRIQAATLVVDSNGDGMHSETAALPLNALLPLASGQGLLVSIQPDVVSAYEPQRWHHVDMAAAAAPSALLFTQESGHLTAVIRFAAPPQVVNAGGSAQQSVELTVAGAADHLGQVAVVGWDVASGVATVYEQPGQRLADLGHAARQVPATISGNEVHIDLSASSLTLSGTTLVSIRAYLLDASGNGAMLSAPEAAIACLLPPGVNLTSATATAAAAPAPLPWPAALAVAAALLAVVVTAVLVRRRPGLAGADGRASGLQAGDQTIVAAPPAAAPANTYLVMLDNLERRANVRAAALEATELSRELSADEAATRRGLERLGQLCRQIRSLRSQVPLEPAQALRLADLEAELGRLRSLAAPAQ